MGQKLTVLVRKKTPANTTKIIPNTLDTVPDQKRYTNKIDRIILTPRSKLPIFFFIIIYFK
jgi:Fe2+ transport system protein B